MKISQAFPSKYLRAADLEDKPHRVVMSAVRMEDIASGEDHKPVLYFKNHQKGVVLNKTNSRTISQAYGDDTDNWAGKSIIIFSAMVDFRGDQVEAIRVRIPKDKIETSPKRMTKQTENPAPDEEATDDIMDTF